MLTRRSTGPHALEHRLSFPDLAAPRDNADEIAMLELVLEISEMQFRQETLRALNVSRGTFAQDN